MRTLWFAYNLVVACAVALLTAHYYYDAGQGLPYVQDIGIHAYVYYGVAAAALVAPAVWASMHLFGGLFFGMAAGGLLDGLRLGFILGFGMAIAKCWLFVLAAAVGVYAGGGPLLYSIGGAVLAFLLFGLHKALMYFWSTTKNAH
jgi:hypothetical protein